MERVPCAGGQIKHEGVVHGGHGEEEDEDAPAPSWAPGVPSSAGGAVGMRGWQSPWKRLGEAACDAIAHRNEP